MRGYLPCSWLPGGRRQGLIKRGQALSEGRGGAGEAPHPFIPTVCSSGLWTNRLSPPTSSMPEQHGGGVGWGHDWPQCLKSLPCFLFFWHGANGSVMSPRHPGVFTWWLSNSNSSFLFYAISYPHLETFFERCVIRKDPHSAIYTANGFSCNRSILEWILLLWYEDKAQGRWERDQAQGEHKLLLSVACAGKKQTNKCFPGCSSLGW